MYFLKDEKIIFKNEKKFFVLFYDKSNKTLIRQAKNGHYLGKYGGFAFNDEVVNFAVKRPDLIEKILIVYNNKKYFSNPKDWVEKGIKVDFGFGKQVVLPTKQMLIVKEKNN